MKKKLDYCIQGQGHSEGQNVNVCLDDIFETTKHFVSRLGIVMHHYESECHAKRLRCYFQGQDHCKNWYNQNITVSDPFVTKLGLIVHHKPECFMEKLDCCVQDQGHSKTSKCQ